MPAGAVPRADVPPDDAALARLCTELAAGAAALVADLRTRAVAVSTKSTITDLVTDADQACERWLTDRIAAHRPADAVLGEEGGGRDGTSGVRWVLDPIDGTVNFVLGIPHYAVSVAVEVDGVVVAGAVADPASGELFCARRGAGAFVGTGPGGADRVALHGPRGVPLSQAVVGTGFGYDARLRQRQAAVVVPLLGQVADVRRLGSAALDLCYVAAGRLDAYYESGLNPWDSAAGGLIATEAGCVAGGPGGGPPGRALYAVAGPAMAAEFFATLIELCADRVLTGDPGAQVSAGG